MPGYLDKINQMKKAGQLDSTPDYDINDNRRKYELNEINELTPAIHGDGGEPPVARPPGNEIELRRWFDWTSKPENFEKWLDWAMSGTDPAGSPQ